MNAPSRIEDPADLDPFTLLPHRLCLRAAVQAQLAQMVRGHSAGFALICIGLNSLSRVNARFGIATGDAYLYAWAQRLRNLVGPHGRCFYLLGSEFVVLTPVESIEDERELRQYLLRWQRGLGQPFELAEKRLDSRVSIGVAQAPRDGNEFDEILANSRAACAEARRADRATFRFYSESDAVRQGRFLDRAGDLQDALQNDVGLALHYQPIVEPRARRVIGLEALIRWEHPRQGRLSPADFVPMAEQTGLIHDMGRWTMRAALQASSEWRDAGGCDVPIAINVSPGEIAEHGFVEAADAQSESLAIPLAALETEITETSMVEHPERTARVLRRLSSRGMGIAIDDFGSGYASLIYLQRFPVSKIKIDRQYIDSMDDNPKSRALITASVQLARDLDVQLVAEGVETASQVDQLLTLGCFLMQGYHFCRPAPLPDILAWAGEFGPAVASA